MKIKSKTELKEIAKGIFERYPKAQRVSCTSDGMAFIVDVSDNAVKNHASKNRYGKKLSITEFSRDEVADKAEGEKEKTAVELIEEIENATEASVVDAILAAEKEDKERKTVIAAAEEKLQALKGGK